MEQFCENIVNVEIYMHNFVLIFLHYKLCLKHISQVPKCCPYEY
jgi:hypothetical protein